MENFKYSLQFGLPWHKQRCLFINRKDNSSCAFDKVFNASLVNIKYNGCGSLMAELSAVVGTVCNTLYINSTRMTWVRFPVAALEMRVT